MAQTAMTDSEINEIASATLREKFHDLGFKASRSWSDFDHDGTPIIRITAKFKYSPRLDRESPIEAIHYIRDRLLDRDEHRFVVINNEYEDQVACEDEEIE